MAAWRRFWTNIRLALRSMAGHKTRTALTALGISLGVAVVLGVNITNATLMDSFNNVFDEAGGKADLTVQDQARNADGFPASIFHEAREMEGVTAAAPSVMSRSLVADELSGWQASTGVMGTLSAGSTLITIGVDPEMDRTVRDIYLTDGTYLKPGEDRYVMVLGESVAEEKGYGLGEDIPILLPGRNAPSEFKIIGIIDQSGAGLINGGSIAFIPLNVAQELMGRAGRYDQIDIVVNDEIAESDTALSELKEDLSRQLGEGVRVVYPGARGEELAKRMASYRLGLDLFSTVAMFIGGFLIYNTFAINVAERTRQIGLFRTIGMTKKGVLVLIFTEAGLLSVVGSGIGLLMGIGMARGMSTTVGFAAGTTVNSLTLPVKGFVRSLSIGLLVTIISALWPALQAIQISPLEALGVKAQSRGTTWRDISWKFGPGLLFVGWAVFNDLPLRDSIAWTIVSIAAILFLFGAAFSVPIVDRFLANLLQPLIRFVFGGVGKIGASNLKRAQSRTLLTIATLMLGIAVNIGTVSLGDSFRYDLSRWTKAATGGDLIVQSPTRLDDNHAQRLDALDGVDTVSPERSIEVWTSGEKVEDEIVFIAIDPQTRGEISQFLFEEPGKDAQPRVFQQLQQGDRVIISTSMAERYDLEVGEDITLETPRGVVDFEVIGVVLDFSGNGLMVYGNWTDLYRYFGVNTVDRFLLSVHPGYNPQAVGQAIEGMLGTRLNLTVDVVDKLLEDVLEITDRSFVMFDTLALLVVSVSAMGVVNTMAISVMERRQELSMLRSIGMTRAQLRKMILAEAGALGLMGGILGLGLGVVLAQMFIVVVQHLMDYELTNQLSTRAIISSAVIALVISQAAALIPAIRASRQPIIKGLADQ